MSESFEKKLYTPRDIEGEPNIEELRQIKELERVLEQHPKFVGLALIGSIAQGYSIESSDIDVNVLFDTPIYYTAEAKEQFTGLYKSAQDKFQQGSRKEISMGFQNINPDFIFDGIEKLKRRPTKPSQLDCASHWGYVPFSYWTEN